jgi:hypothetical protein
MATHRISVDITDGSNQILRRHIDNGVYESEAKRSTCY